MKKIMFLFGFSLVLIFSACQNATQTEKMPTAVEKTAVANARLAVKIEGMTCSGCQKMIEKSLKKADGVVDCKVDLEAATAQIEYDKNLTDEESILAVFPTIGEGHYMAKAIE